MAINTFTPAYLNAILLQKEEGTVCATCGKTEIEHCFEPEKCCHERERPAAQEIRDEVKEHTAKFIGFFDYPEQKEPTYDPPHDGPCIICYQPLTPPVKTVSLRRIGELPRSYFYRAHKICYEESPSVGDKRAILMMESGQ